MARRIIFLLVASLAGCAGLKHGVYADSHTRYRIGTLPNTWQPVQLTGNNISYISRDSGHSLAVNSTCEDHDDPSLEVLTRHLMMGFEARQTVTQTHEQLDGREALRTHVLAQLDGVPVELVLVVLKKDGCVYDFTYLSPVGHLREHLDTFNRVLSQFTTEVGA